MFRVCIRLMDIYDRMSGRILLYPEVSFRRFMGTPQCGQNLVR